MKKFLLLFIFSAIYSSVFSQTGYTISKAMELYKINNFMTDNSNTELTADDIAGSPYLNDEFISGTVYTTSKIQYNDVKLRYNIYSDQIEFNSDGQILELSTPEILEKIVFGEYTMYYIPFTTSKKMKNGYFILLEDGEASLYARPEIIFKKEEKPGGYKDAKPAEFVRNSDSYYIRIGTEAANLVSKNSFVDIFPDNKDKIETFIKNNKIKPNKVEGLKELVQYYNSL